MFIGTLAVLHIIRPSRGKAVVMTCSGPCSRVWVSDMLGGQRGRRAVAGVPGASAA